jgi:phage terminase small subunit
MAGHGVQTDVPFVRAFDSATLPPHIRAAVSEVSLTDKGSFKIKLHDKIGAIEKLMRHLGMFEKDNKQKADGLVELIQAAQGSALPIAGADDE